MTAALTLGVVGHVDHGKSTLVTALTGMPTDRLPEERARGLSIVLGFAYFETPGAVIDLIDVPGHENFVRAMIAGASGIDGIALVVAATEGIMPQTREHVAIARLLGIDRGIIVITKTDLVPAERRAAVTAEIRAYAADTFLADAPLIAVGSGDAQSIAAVKAAMAALARAPLARPAGRGFFLPVDRVFTVRGFGVVATGTLRGGTLRAQDRVEIQPQALAATVRGLERHNRAVAEAQPGQRVAVNLRGIERAAIARGDVIAAPGLLIPAQSLDVDLRLLEDAPAPLANGARVRMLTGTTEALARVRLLDSAALEPGATAFAQLRCERPIATRAGEHYLVRAHSPLRTLGGGHVIDTQPPRHRRFDARVLERLAHRASGDTVRLLGDLLAAAGPAGIDCAATAADLGLTLGELHATAQALGAVALGAQRYAAAASFAPLLEQIVAQLREFHAAQPRERGLALAQLQGALTPATDPATLRHALAMLAAAQRIELADGAVRLHGFDPFAGFTEAERRVLASIETAFRDGGLAPPTPGDVVGTDRRAATLYRLLLEQGRLVRLQTYKRGTQIVLHADTLAMVCRQLADRYPHPQRFTVAQARDLLRSTRQHIVPIMEHLDSMRFTIRVGDSRQLQASPAGANTTEANGVW